MTHYIKLDTHTEDVTASVLMNTPRSTLIVAPPHPDGYNFVQRVRNRLFKRGLVVRSRRGADGKLAVWAVDRGHR